MSSWFLVPLLPILEASGSFTCNASVRAWHPTSRVFIHSGSEWRHAYSSLQPLEPVFPPHSLSSAFPSALLSSISSSELCQLCYCVYDLLTHGGARVWLSGTVLARRTRGSGFNPQGLLREYITFMHTTNTLSIQFGPHGPCHWRHNNERENKACTFVAYTV